MPDVVAEPAGKIAALGGLEDYYLLAFLGLVHPSAPVKAIRIGMGNNIALGQDCKTPPLISHRFHPIAPLLG